MPEAHEGEPSHAESCRLPDEADQNLFNEVKWKMKKRVFACILAAAMLFCLAACGGGTETTSPATDAPSTDTPASDSDVIKIGHIVHMTGSAVESGGYEKNGAELAVEEINAAGGVNGKQLVLVQEDGKSTNQGSVAAFQKLLEDDEIVAVIGPSPSTQFAAMIPTIDEAGIPVATGGTNYSLTHSDCPWVFRFRPHDGFSAQAMVRYAVDELGATKIAVLHGSDSFGVGGYDLVAQYLDELYGMEPILDQSFNNDEKDYTAVITNIKESGADCIISYMAMSPDVGMFATQRLQQGLDIPWIGSPSVTAVAGRELAGEALYGVYAVSDFHVDGNEKATAFAAAYEEKFGREPDFYSAWTYDAIYCFAEAFKNAADLEPESIREAILALEDFEGVEGTYNFDENGDGLDAYYIVVNNENNIEVVTKIEGNR